jgi:hypothetical protein
MHCTVDSLEELDAMTKWGIFMAEVLHIGYPDVIMSSLRN